MHELEFDHRLATPEEQEILSQYVGWGGLADAFDETKSNWSEKFKELYPTLSPDEYEQAKAQTLTAHFTLPVVIKAMYKALSNMGFTQGNILEPSCGIGNFITSIGTMDKQNSNIRKYIAQRADLVGAIRLPNNAFKANAGTEVTADTVFTADTTIYAQWNYTGSTGGGGTTRYTVSFDTDGSNKVSSKTVTRNTTVAEPTAPTKTGYTFDGWYTDKELTTVYDFTAKVTKNFTLYAKWTEIEKEPDKPTQPVDPTAPEWKNPFTDVKKSDWFYTNVEYAVNNKLMNGTTATTFAPNEPLTRGVLVTVLYRAEGEPTVNKSIPFSGVDANAYYANAVIWAQQNGIVNDITENEFAPDSNITREQIAAILQRFLEANK